MTDDEREKLKGDLFKADLDSHGKLQTWGSSLFLGALALLAMQLVEWERGPDKAEHIQLTLPMVLLPAFVGLVGFIFLRIVNYRARENRSMLWNLADLPVKDRPGWLGWLFALMPIAFGYLVSWDLALGNPDRTIHMAWISVLGGLVFFYVLIIHIRSAFSGAPGCTEKSAKTK